MSGYQALYTPQRTPPGARVGVYSAATCWSGAAGSGFDFANSRYFGMKFWRSGGTTNNQGLWCFNNLAATGWRIILGNDRSANLFFGGNLRAFDTNQYQMLNHLLVGQDGSGNLKYWLNGAPSVAIVSPGAYVAAGALAVMSIGADKSNNANPLSQGSTLFNYVIDGYNPSDAEGRAFTGDVNRYDRWQLAPSLTALGSPLVCLYDWSSWNGSDATFAGTGSGAITLTRGGALTKTTMPAYTIRRIPKNAVFGNAFWDYYENGAIRKSTFSFVKFTTDSADTSGGPAGVIVVEYGKNLGIPGNANAGVNTAGSNIEGNNVGGAELDCFDVMRYIDVPGIGAGSKDVIVTECIQSFVTASNETKPSASPQFIAVKEGSTFTWADAYASIPADYDIFGSDSLLEQVAGMTNVHGVKGPCYDAASMLQRAALSATRRVVCSIAGGGTWFDRISSAAKITAYVAELKRLALGSSTNHFRIQLGTNDFGFNTYVLQTTFRSNLADFFTALFAAGIPGLKIQLLGTTDRTGGTTPNASGWVLQDFRDSISAAVTTFANANCTYVNAAAAVSAGNRTDGLHYNAAGHIEYSNFLTANPVP